MSYKKAAFFEHMRSRILLVNKKAGDTKGKHGQHTLRYENATGIKYGSMKQALNRCGSRKHQQTLSHGKAVAGLEKNLYHEVGNGLFWTCM